MKHSLRIAHTHAWKRRGALPLLLAITLTFVIVASVSAAVAITATKTYAIITGDGDTKADPGETIKYTVAVKNNDIVDATGVNFSDTIDTNTTLVAGSVNVSPLAINDSYDTIGNTLLEVGVAAGPDPAVHLSSDLFTNDAEFLADVGTFNITSHTNPANGTLVTFNNGTGTFSYLPNAGFAGVDSFTYTLVDSGGLTDTATVTINVINRVWYVKNNATAGGLGRSTDPFDTLAEAQAASAASDTIYVFQGNGTTAGQNAGIALKSGQRLLGEGVPLTVLVGVNGGSSPTTLRAAGSAPLIDNTGGTGIGVSVPDISNVQIFGLNIAGNTNAVNVATTAANSGSFELANNTIRSAGANGVDVNGGGSGALTVNLHDNTVTATGNGIDIQRTAGNVNIIAFNNNVVTGNTGGIGMNIVGPSVTFDAAPGGAFNTVSGGTTIIGQSGNGVGTSGMVLTNVSGDLSFTDLDIFAGGGAGLSASGTAAYTGSAGFQIAVGSGVATISATGGPAVSLSTVTAALPFNTISSTNSATTGVSLDTVLGTFSAGSGSSITNATGTDFSINAGTATVTYDGTINDTTGRLVSVTSATGGTKSFTGAISDSGGPSTGVSLTNNSGATINFSGGLALSTGAGAAFTATGGGTVNATQNNASIVNTLTTTTGTALNIANTTIGASGLTFRSISSNGAASGIILNTTGTSGGLTISGNGGSCTSAGTCTGGAIQNSTSDGVVLTSTQSPSFTRFNVTDSAGTGADDGIVMTNITGSVTIDNSALINSPHNGLTVDNNNTNLTGFNFTNSTISCASGQPCQPSGSIGNDGLLLTMRGTSVLASGLISGSTFSGVRAVAVQVQTNDSGRIGANSGGSISAPAASNSIIVQSNTFTGNGQGIDIAQSQISNLTFQVLSNTINGISTASGGNGSSNAINVFSAAGADTGPTSHTMVGKVDSNSIGTQGVKDSGSGFGNGIRVVIQGQNTQGNITVSNNTIRESAIASPMLFIGQNGAAAAGTATAKFKIINNTLPLPSGTNVDVCGTDTPCIDAGIFILADEGTPVCNVITGNSLFDATAMNGSSDIYLAERAGPPAGAQITVEGTGGSNSTYIQANNTLTGASKFIDEGGNTSQVVPGGCGTFVAMAPSDNQALAQYPAEDNRMAASFASNSDSNAASAFAPAYDLGSMYQPAAWVTPNAQSVSPATALPTSNQSIGSKQIPPRLAPPTAPALSGETVPVTIGTLPAGKTVTITFQVMVNNPLPAGTTRILNQSNVTYTGGPVGGLNTTDPAPSADPACTAAPAIGTQTCTPVDLPDTTVSSISRQTPLGANTNAGAVTWRVTFADAISGLTSSNFTLLAGGSLTGTSITSVTAVGGAPATQWDVLVNTGAGDGLLELNMTSAAGLSHDVLNLPFTSGEDYTIDRTAPTVASIKRQSPASNPTNADVLVFRVTFSEPVTSVGANSFVATGTTTTIDSSVTSITPNLVFDFSVNGTLNGDLVNFNGTVGLDVASSPVITDMAGNTLVVAEPAPASNDETYTLDNAPPAAPVVVAPANGSSTSDTTPTVTGTAEAGTTVTVFFDGASAGTTTADGAGNWTFTAIPALIDGSHTVKATAADALGNTSVDSNINTFTVDTLPPPAPVVQTPTNGSSTTDTTPTVTGTAEANSTVSVFFDGVSAGTTTADASGNWTFTPVAALSAASHTVKSRATDAAGNTSVDSNTNTFTIDTTAPTVTINQGGSQADPTGSSPIIFDVVFSEPVTGFATGDVTLAGTAGATTGTVTGGPTTYTVSVSGMTGDGTVIAGIAAGVAQDAATNSNAASTSTDNSVLYDTTPPDVTINQAVGQADPTNTAPINFTVIFSEPVTGFATGDVDLSAGTAPGTLTGTVTGGPTTYNVAVTGMTGDGTVIAGIPASVATDLASKPNNASTSTDNTVTYDPTAPDTTITGNPSNPTSSTSASFTFTGSDTGTGVASFACDLDGGGFSPCTSPQSYASLADGSHSFQVRATDNAGNTDATPASFTWVVDATAPDTLITSNPSNPSNSSAAGFSFTGNDGSGTGVASFECKLDAAAFAACTSPQSYTGLSDGSHTFQVRAIDSAGNADATPASFTWTVDTIAPTVVVSSVTTSPTNSSPIVVTITFSEPVTGFTASSAAGDLSITNGTDSNPTGSGTTYTFDLTPSGQGPVTVVVPSGSAFDVATNPNAVSNTFSITYDTISPTVTINQAAGQADPTGVSPINYTVIFDEPVTGFIGSDVAIGGTAGATTATVTGGPTTYNVAVSGMTSAGDVIVTLPAGTAQDLAGNTSAAATSTDNTVTFDPVVPVVTGIVRADPSPTNATTVNYTVTFAKSVSGVDASDFTFTTSGVTGAAITNITGSGTTWTVTVSTGTGDGTLRLDLVDDDTIVDIAANPLGGKGLGNGNFTSGEVYTIDKTAPAVASIVRASASPTNAATVDFTITFTEIVSGVNATDFSLATSGVTGAAITNIAGSSTTWTATVNTGSGSGTIGLNLVDDDTIVDLVGNVLGSTGTGNGNFTGEVYTIDKTAPQAGNLVAANITTGGGATQTFTIVVSDNLAIDIASLDASDIRVTGPSGFNQPATLVSVTPATNGTPRTATYQISAPGGAWDTADNGTYTVTLQGNQVSDTAGNTAAAGALGTFNVDVKITRFTVLLPIIMHSAAQAPDLVISSVTLSPSKTSFTSSEPVQISVVIKNQGNAPTTPFWVDLYLNPSSTPTLNLIWNKLCSLQPCYGIAWQVTQPLAPGAEITLTSTVGSFATGYTNWHDRLAAGTTDLYVQADSWNPGKTVGASGDTNPANNLFHLSGLHVTGQNVASAGADVTIPERPR